MIIPTKLKFEELEKIEPGLSELLAAARDYRPVLGKCPSSDWYKHFKPQLIVLVGMMAQSDNPVIRSSGAYSLAYETIYKAMSQCPKGCRGCG